LYIAREIVGSHGGTVSVTSSQASGTLFTVRLPREYVMHSGQPILDEQHLQTM
jgi:signal transduction histidine kinase